MKQTIKYFSILTLFSIGFILSGCLSKIDLDIPRENQDNLSIQGTILKSNPSIIEVGVKKIFDFTGVQSFVKVQEVTITDESGIELEIPQSSEGIYRILVEENDPSFEVKEGKSYKLRVRTFAGQVFESTYEPLIGVPKATDLKGAFVTEPFETVPGELDFVDKIEFSIDSPLEIPGEEDKARLLWEFEETYEIVDSPLMFNTDPKTCWVTQNIGINDITLVNGNELNGNMITDFPLFKRNISTQFAHGYYFTVFQKSLSSTAFEYWRQVQQSLIREGNMFEAPVGKIRSNIVNINDEDEEVFGFFYATVQDTIRVYVSPETAGNPTQLCPPNVPPPPGGGCPILICCDCLDAERSTTTKPSWWEF